MIHQFSSWNDGHPNYWRLKLHVDQRRSTSRTIKSNSSGLVNITAVAATSHAATFTTSFGYLFIVTLISAFLWQYSLIIKFLLQAFKHGCFLPRDPFSFDLLSCKKLRTLLISRRHSDGWLILSVSFGWGSWSDQHPINHSVQSPLLTVQVWGPLKNHFFSLLGLLSSSK